jgi:hypothetical protein
MASPADEAKSLPPVPGLCDNCRYESHELCRDCHGCGCIRSAQARATVGPKLPDPTTYKGCS